MDFNTLRETDSSFVANTYARFALDIESGSGAVCRSSNGREFVDLTSGIGVNTLGFCDRGWISAVTAQLGRLQHISNLYYTQPCAMLAEELCGRTGMKRVFFANSGAEANEGAIKAARKYSLDKYGSGRYGIVTLKNSFHGRTMATLTATGQDVFHKNFDPFLEGFKYTEPNIAALQEIVSDETCAVMIELIQGEGGVVPMEQEFVQSLAQLCSQMDILFIVDEVQTGMGRTGSLFLYQQYGIMPDIVTSAKGLGGGLPIGAILFSEKTEKTLGAGDHGSTFGGNPVVCAGALEILGRLDEEFLQQVTEKGRYLTKELLKLPYVRSVCGRGLMLGLELEGISSRALAERAIEQGVMILTAKEKARLLPPLSISYEEIDRALQALEKIQMGMEDI